MADILIVRLILVVTLALMAVFVRPFGWSAPLCAACGMGVALAIILFEIRLSHSSLKRLIGAAAGSILGILGAYLISLVVRSAGFDSRSTAFVNLVILLVMGYVGLIVGAEKGELLNLGALGGLFGGDRHRRNAKLLDTSVIIDGRIADIAATGFLEGPLLVPQFVLRELQNVADSSDAQKRGRGRRGLEMLQRMQKAARAEINIIDDDCAHLREVDHKLIELARRCECKLVTNDGNLARMAQLQHVQVLNINELANALKPLVLPGEPLRVLVVKEGKEANQGVGYLDDGTMVVIDHARRLVSRTVDVAVTSVLQTTAGKMVFARLEERSSEAPFPPLAAGSSGGSETAAWRRS